MAAEVLFAATKKLQPRYVGALEEHLIENYALSNLMCWLLPFT